MSAAVSGFSLIEELSSATARSSLTFLEELSAATAPSTVDRASPEHGSFGHGTGPSTQSTETHEIKVEKGNAGRQRDERYEHLRGAFLSLGWLSEGMPESTSPAANDTMTMQEAIVSSPRAGSSRPVADHVAAAALGRRKSKPKKQLLGIKDHVVGRQTDAQGRVRSTRVRKPSQPLYQLDLRCNYHRIFDELATKIP